MDWPLAETDSTRPMQKDGDAGSIRGSVEVSMIIL